MSEWSPKEREVYAAVRKAGALTARRVQETYGPRPNWHRLITAEVLQEVKTINGPVLTLSLYAHEAENSTQRLRGPGSLADRAYMLDAIKMLEDQGYMFQEYDYKRGKEHGTFTAHITRSRMDVPADEMRRILAHWGDAPAKSAWQTERRGRPWLYARCSGGGVQPTELRRLLKLHKQDLWTWRAPLLIVVPKEEGPLRSFVRRYLAEKERVHDQNRDLHARPIPHTPDLRLFELPLPRQVYRPSTQVQGGRQG